MVRPGKSIASSDPAAADEILGGGAFWSLTFEDPSVEAAFREDYFWSTLDHGRLCHVLAAFFFLGYGFLEWALIPSIGLELLSLRALFASAWGLGLLLSYVGIEVYRRVWQPLFAFYVVWAGLGHLAMMRMVGPEAAPLIYPGLALTLFFGYAFIRLRFWYAALSGAMVVFAYPLAVVPWAQGVHENALSDFSYLLGIGFLGTIIAHRLEYLVRRDFLRNAGLSDAWKKARAAKNTLEHAVGVRTVALAEANQALAEKVAALEESREESRKLQEQLEQSRKLEAIGRLAGGVAHDFNNILTVIITYAELALLDPEASRGIKEDLDAILTAGRKAASLTQQLLAFSRNQVLQPEILDLNQVVGDLLKMLGRVLPENIRLQASLADDLPLVFVDRGQMEQVLMNLAVNARDAMPEGGVLTLETRRTIVESEYARNHSGMRAGVHAELVVSDTGMGMNQETLTRVFEPFFTTKGAGKGTGLGLATVFGIVNQSEGSIWVSSEPGKGSTFKIHLPEAPQDGVRRAQPGGEVQEGEGGTELLLLVEDDPVVRAATGKILADLGYRVAVAANGRDGLELAGTMEEPVDLLVTDVVMPGMSGLDLARELRRIWPDLRVLFMSGYTANAIAHKGVLDPGLHLLDKPFSRAGLARKIRVSLSAPPSPL